jgi:hypothetical protein
VIGNSSAILILGNLNGDYFFEIVNISIAGVLQPPVDGFQSSDGFSRNKHKGIFLIALAKALRMIDIFT